MKTHAERIPSRSARISDSCNLFHPPQSLSLYLSVYLSDCSPSDCLSTCLSTCLTAAPVIVSPPGEVYNVSGSQVYLSCEAVGVPTPVLTWKKVIGGKKREGLLPGDRDNVAIQTRGGPEKHEVTGWVLVSLLHIQYIYSLNSMNPLLYLVMKPDTRSL
ncbi:insulin-like growth factor-binding protein 7 [Etheostoma cragini]|uniref:insulin-like growth factor-binding protein 7 n=1 Tax=Etheostoma cragini TaxID=417921 RepID=UPI00155E20F2|nr:insulin-like growth factor-binding protein 7 [Etheostoma cragini]